MAMIAPTDRSNSPAIISKVTPMTTIALIDAELRKPDTVRTVAKWGTNKEKRMRPAASVISGGTRGESPRKPSLSRLSFVTSLSIVVRPNVSPPARNVEDRWNGKGFPFPFHKRN
jgi:hypothetical protein